MFTQINLLLRYLGSIPLFVSCRLLLVVDPGADSILMDVRKAVSESTDDVYEFELKAVEALLSVSSKRLVRFVFLTKYNGSCDMHIYGDA